MEETLADGISSFTKDLWKEDAITIDVIKRVRAVLDGAQIEGDSRTARIVARAFKADGAVEEKYGDIAVLLRITYRDGQVLQGVAFYEAKRRDWDKNTLPAATKKQLAAMHRATYDGRLLVFDRDRVVSALAETSYAPWWDRYRRIGDPMVAPVTHALAIPLGPVLETARFDTSLYKFGTPFGCQLVLRNLQGLDLDHHASRLHAANGYAERMDVPTIRVSARVVLVVGVGKGPHAPELPDVNPNLLRPIE